MRESSTEGDVCYYAPLPTTPRKPLCKAVVLLSVPDARRYLSQLSAAERAAMLACASAPLLSTTEKRAALSTPERLFEYFDFRPVPPAAR